MRLAHFAALTLGLGIVALSPQSGLAQELLRWGLPADNGLQYSVEKSADESDVFGQRTSYVIFQSDFIDGHKTASPCGNLNDLILSYAFALPEQPVAKRAQTTRIYTHDFVHSGSMRITPVESEIQTRVTRKGVTYLLQHLVKLKSKPPAAATGAFAEASFQIEAVYHRKKHLISAINLRGFWLDPAKTTHPIAHKLTAKSLLDCSTTAVERLAKAAIDRATKRVLLPYLSGGGDRSYERYPLGYRALVLYAALKAGVSPRQSAITQTFADLEELPWNKTYSVALAILCAEAGAMHKSDSGRNTIARFRKGKLSPQRTDLLARLTNRLIQIKLPNRGAWSYGPEDDDEHQGQTENYDLSNTQFAILALHAAARSGVPISTELWQQIAKHLLRHQADSGPETRLDLDFDPLSALEPPVGARSRTAAARTVEARGFGYRKAGYVYTSMTAAGCGSLAIAYHSLQHKNTTPKLLADLHGGIEASLAWLQRHYSIRANWPDHHAAIYTLYSLEKAYELTGIRRIGGHDWWSEGAMELLGREVAGGGWGEPDRDPTETAIAVLFLTRASLEPELSIEALTRPQTGSGTQQLPATVVLLPDVGQIDVVQLARATNVADKRERRQRVQHLTDAVGLVLDHNQPLLVPALARLLNSPFPEVQKAAVSLLRDIVGERLKTTEAALAFYGQWQHIGDLANDGGSAARHELRQLVSEKTLPVPNLKASALALARLQDHDAVLPLLDRLDQESRLDLRVFLANLLVGMTSWNPKYNPHATNSQRLEATARWRAWWKDNRPHRSVRPGRGLRAGAATSP